LSPSYSISAFEKWMDRGNNFAIFDTGGTTDELRSRFELNKRLISTLKVTGFTKNARERLARKAVENLKEVLEEIK
jgi:lactate dehydrogenase-like 2-hydroxyacid dehydrogenase